MGGTPMSSFSRATYPTARGGAALARQVPDMRERLDEPPQHPVASMPTGPCRVVLRSFRRGLTSRPENRPAAGAQARA